MFCFNCGNSVQSELPYRCPECGITIWRNPRCCAGALILEGYQIYLVRRNIDPWRGCWDIPGGYCENKETPEECAVREVFEETGMAVQIESLFGIWNDEVKHMFYGDNICIYYVVSVLEKDNTFKSNMEMSEGKWFDLEALPSDLAFPSHIPEVLQSIKRSEWGVNK